MKGKTILKLAKLLLPCLIVVALAAGAKADCGGLGFGYPNGFGGGFSNYGAQSYNNFTPPYFALHPPVYYGQRFSRPYGVSPYAVGPQLQTNPEYAPSRRVDRSVVIENPYILPMETIIAPEGVVNNEPVQPLVIENPYFGGETVKYTAK